LLSLLRKNPCPAKRGTFDGECYRQNHPDRTNLRILNFADNKDLHGGELSESLTSVPVIDGTQLETKIKSPLPTHSSNNVCLCTLDFKPRFSYKNFFFSVLHFCSFFPSSLLFCLPCHSLYSTTSNERTNKQTVAFLFSRHSRLLLTITNFLLFASFLFFFYTRSATTMTTAIGTTMVLMATPPLLHVAHKDTFKTFKCKKHEESLAIFF
jgi:hypothetical protein